MSSYHSTKYLSQFIYFMWSDSSNHVFFFSQPVSGISRVHVSGLIQGKRLSLTFSKTPESVL